MNNSEAQSRSQAAHRGIRAGKSIYAFMGFLSLRTVSPVAAQTGKPSLGPKPSVALASHSAQSGAAGKGILVSYTNPAGGYVSLALYSPTGQIVRTLLTKAKRSAGPQTEWWDGLDDAGQPVAPGQYGVKALSSPGITPRFVCSVMNSGNPSWGNKGGRYGWGGDHGSPVGAAADTAGNAYLLWQFNESGNFLIQVDATGQKQWGSDISWGDFDGGATAIAFDDGRLYVAKDGAGKGEESSGGLFLYDAATGRRINFPDGANTKLVSRWKTSLAKGSNGNAGANIRGVAISPDRIYCSLNLENKVVALDKQKLQVQEAETLNLPHPTGIAYDRERQLLYVITGSNLVAVAKGSTQKVLIQNLDQPYGLALDKTGNLYVSQRGARMQVQVFAPDGTALRTIGETGGRPAIGHFNPNGLYQPAGLAVDTSGHLWVAEEDASPKRISLWDTASGKLVRDFFGSAAYAPMMAPDLEKPEEVYIHNTRFIVDYDTGSVTPDSTVYRRTSPNMLPGSEQGYGWMGNTFELATIGGKRFAYNGHGGVFAAGKDTFKPLLYIGQGFDGLTSVPPGQVVQWNAYVWQDANTDGLVNPDEVRQVPFNDLYNNINEFGGTFFPGGRFIKGKRVFTPTGLSAVGVPQYLKPEDTPAIAPPNSPVFQYSNWLDVWPSLASNWRDFYAIASLPATNRGAQGGGGDCIVRFGANGNIQWRYSRVAVSHALSAPLAKMGDLFGAMRLAGEATLPKEQGGEVLCVGCYRGYYGFLNEDGLFIDQVGYDNGRGPAPAFDTFFIENFSGYFFKHPRTGKCYLFCGDVDGRILELRGFDQIRRFAPAPVTVTTTQVKQLLGSEDSPTSNGDNTSLRASKGSPSVTGPVVGWNEKNSAKIELDEKASAKVNLAYDATNLYARFDVPDTTPWHNGSTDWHFAFKGGDGVDLQLGKPWTGDGKRHAQPGDVRLLLVPTADGSGVQAVAMWKLVPPGMDKAPMLYKSPTGEESFERVIQLPEVKATVIRRPDGYTVRAVIPWTALGLAAPVALSELQGDAGVLLSDGGGTKTILRRYLYNQDTGIVEDIPSEVRVVPANWGKVNFE